MYKLILPILLMLNGVSLAQDFRIQGELSFDESSVVLGSVAIYSLPDSTLVKGSYVDSTYFTISFNPIQDINYYLKIRFHSYEDTLVKISLLDTVFDIGTITLRPKTLTEVQVSFTRPLFERTIDGIKVNVEGTNLETLSNLFEVLKASPKISSSDNESIQIIGKGVPLILIDRQPILSMDELKAIPADQIHHIEIMTNPSAKYRAQSKGGGVIEVITKNFHLEGYKVVVGLDGGINTRFRPSAGMRFGLSFKKKKFSLNMNLGGSYDRSNSYSNSFGETTDGSGRRYSTDNTSENWWTWHNFNFKSAYQFNSNHLLSIGLRSSGSFGGNDVNNHSEYYELDDTLSQQSKYSKSSNTWLNNSAFLKYTIQLDTNGSSFDANLNYLLKVNEGKTDVESSFINNLDGLNTNFSRRNDSKDRPNVGELSLDYQHVFDTTGWKANIGGIFSLLKNGKRLNQYSVNNEVQILDPELSNSYDYKEQVAGIYAEVTKMWKFFGFRLGIRGEYTYLDGKSASLQKQFIDSSYFSPFPSGSLIIKPNDKLSFTLYYQSGISRPSFSNYDPFIRIIDSVTVEYGNPYLKPEMSQSIGLQTDLFNRYNISLEYSYKRSPISNISFVSDSSFKISTTPWNASSNEAIALNFNIPLETKWLRGSNEFWVTFSNYKYPIYFNRPTFNTLSYGLYSRLSFTLPKKFELTSFLFLSQYATDQSTAKPVIYWGLRLSKKFKDSNLQAYFDVDNLLPVLNRTSKFSGNYIVYSESRYDFTSFKIGIFYKFGKLKQGVDLGDSNASQSGRL